MIDKKVVLRRIITTIPILFIFYARAIIITSSSFQNVFEIIQRYKTDETLLLIDVDQTLLEPTGLVGTGMWCNLIRTNAFEKYHHQETAIKAEAEARLMVAPLLTYQCIEPETAHLVNQLQQQKINILAFTARDPLLADHTRADLASCNINFTKQIPLSLTKCDSLTHCMKYGIIFCKSQCSKGIALADLLRNNHCLYTTIMFVDDAIHNLQNAQEELEKHNPDLPFIGIHYVPVPILTKAFSLEQVRCEIECMNIDQSLKEHLIALHKKE